MTFHRIYNMHVLDALKQIPDESVDFIMTSPPYYGLRSYKGADTIWGGNSECNHEWVIGKETLLHENRNNLNGSQEEAMENAKETTFIFKNSSLEWRSCKKCGAWRGQLGLEPTYQMYIEHLLMITKELKRVLKKSGTLFWNMGDSYSGKMGSRAGWQDPKYSESREEGIEDGETVFLDADYGNIPRKSMMMIPERLAIGMIDQGWILRNKLIWYKRNGMPASVKDRFSNKYEFVYFFVKSPRYYFNLDAVRKPLDLSSLKRIKQLTIEQQFQTGKSAEFSQINPNMDIKKILMNMHQKYADGNNYINSHSYYFDDDGNLVTDPKDASRVAENNDEGPENWKYNVEMFPEFNSTRAGLYRKKITDIAREEASRLFPNDLEAQKEYVTFMNRHAGGINGGTNPGDVVEFFREKGSGGNFDYGGIKSPEASHYNENGVNPGDVIDDYARWYFQEREKKSWHDHEHDLEMGLGQHRNEQDSVHYPYPYGSNPGDIVNVPAVRHKSWASTPGHEFGHERKYEEGADGGDFFDIPTRPHPFAHFAIYPETLVEPFMKAGCPPQGVVLDPFAGSGTTAVVAKRMGHSTISIEISMEYVEIIKQRMNWGSSVDGAEWEIVLPKSQSLLEVEK